MLVQFCSWFLFYVPLFKSHALLCTTMAKKRENIIIAKVYTEPPHVHNQTSAILEDQIEWFPESCGHHGDNDLRKNHLMQNTFNRL